MSFIGDGCGHGGPYGRTRRGRQLLDLSVQPPDDPLHGFATLDQIRENVHGTEFLLFFIFFSSNRRFYRRKGYCNSKHLKNKFVLRVW